MTLDGRPIAGPGPERGVVFQEYALFPWLTVAGNIAFGPASCNTGPAEVDRRVRECVALVRLDGFDNKYPHELSGGMRQRVGLARALSVDSDVLLMDEPFSAVDEQTRRKFQEDLLLLVATERKTFIFVTHSIEEAVYVSDRIVLLSPRPGRVSKVIAPAISREGDPDAIRRHPVYLDTVDAIWRGLKQYID